MSEFAKIQYRVLIVESGRRLRRIVVSQVLASLVDVYVSCPLLSVFAIKNAFESALVIYANRLILPILRDRSWPQVASLAIQAVMVHMIYRRSAKNEVVQKDPLALTFSAFTHGVVPTGVYVSDHALSDTEMGVPRECRNAFEVFWRDFCDITKCEGNLAVC